MIQIQISEASDLPATLVIEIIPQTPATHAERRHLATLMGTTLAKRFELLRQGPDLVTRKSDRLYRFRSLGVLVLPESLKHHVTEYREWAQGGFERPILVMVGYADLDELVEHHMKRVQNIA